MERINILHSHAKQRNVTQRKGKAMEEKRLQLCDLDKNQMGFLLDAMMDPCIGDCFLRDTTSLLFRLFDLLRVGLSEATENDRYHKARNELRDLITRYCGYAVAILQDRNSDEASHEIFEKLWRWQARLQGRLELFGIFVFSERSDFWKMRVDLLMNI